MHVVYVTSELATKEHPSDGLASFVSNMAMIIASHKHKVDIIYVSTKQEDNLWLNSSIDITNVFIPKNEWDELACISELAFNGDDNSQKRYRTMLVGIRKAALVKQKLEEMNREDRIDIVHFSNLGGFSLFMGNEIPYVVRISGFDNIYAVGAEMPNAKLEYADNPIRIQDVIEYRALSRASFTISPSKLCADIGRKYLGIKPEVIESPFYLNVSEYDYSELSRVEGKKYVLFYGRLNRIKGIHVVAELVYRLLEEHPDLSLVIAGSNREILLEDGKYISGLDYVYDLAREHKNRIVYLGQLTKEKLYPIIENAEVILLPSRMDNLPNACIEAMALGKIIVASNGASYDQLIIDKKNGFLCEIDNPDSFLGGIDSALSLSQKEKDKISEEAKKVVKRLAPDKVYHEYKQYYKYVIDNWGLAK